MEWIYDKMVTDEMISENDFNIKKVTAVNLLNSFQFSKEFIIQIEKIIFSGNINEIAKLPNPNPEEENKFREFLYVLLIKDQNDISYIVTVYDSNALYQDSEILKIYKI
jgi:hypothetical protein